MAHTVRTAMEERAGEKQAEGLSALPWAQLSLAWQPQICDLPRDGISPALLYNLEEGTGRWYKFGGV